MPKLPDLPACDESSSLPARFKIAMEKRIEAFWHQSDRQGAPFDDFIADVLAILIVLRHRQRLKNPARQCPHRR